MENNVLKVALEYREKLLFSVIPVRRKKALVEWKECQTRLPSHDEIRDWFENWPGANVAIITGRLSNLTIVDADNAAARQKISSLLPENFRCPKAKSPRGGIHFYFAHQPSLKTKADIFPKCDIRSEGGYIMAFPSARGDGK